MLVIAGLYVFHRHLVYTTFDPVGAEVVGIKVRFVEYVLLALLALVIVISIQAAGIVLVMAMLITPAATGFLLARRFVGVMLVGAVIGVLSAIVGHVPVIPRQYANWPGHGARRDRDIRPYGSQGRVDEEERRLSPRRHCRAVGPFRFTHHYSVLSRKFVV